MNVLLVENDEPVRTCLIELLLEVGLRVIAVSTATVALALSNETDTPAVLVADVHLGTGMHGFGLAAVARCRWPSPHFSPGAGASGLRIGESSSATKTYR